MIDCIIRDFLDTDRAFVADAWLNTLRAATEESRRIDWDSFREHHGKRIDAIIDKPGVLVHVAAPPGDDLTIYGYLVIDSPERVIHMLFVKKPFRRQGVAKKLLSGVELADHLFTGWSRDVGEWILPKFQKEAGRDKFGKLRFEDGLRYDPYYGEAP